MPPVIKTYFDAIPTIKAARAAGISVDDYVEKSLSRDVCSDSQEGGVGTAKRVIERLLASAELPAKAHCLEIGPGTGRYVAELFKWRPSSTAEFYETDPGWAHWLVARFAAHGAIGRNADGHTLRETESGSADLCAAHGVFVYLDTMITFGYLREMVRCTRTGGYLYFDILDSDRSDIVDLIERTIVNCAYLIPISGRVVLQFMERLGMNLVQQFEPADLYDCSTYLLFRKGPGGTTL